MARLGLIAGGAALLLAGTGIGWATSVVTREPPEVASEAQYVEVEATQGEVSASVATVVNVIWPTSRAAVNQAAGVITGVSVRRGGRVAAGDALYRINERPVIVAKGRVPAFRDLKAGTMGADVRQFTALLQAKGYLRASTRTMTSAVVGAVKAWQRRLGVEAELQGAGIPPEGGSVIIQAERHGGHTVILTGCTTSRRPVHRPSAGGRHRRSLGRSRCSTEDGRPQHSRAPVMLTHQPGPASAMSQTGRGPSGPSSVSEESSVASGSGKSTLLHILGSVDQPTEGKVIVEGTDISTMNYGRI